MVTQRGRDEARCPFQNQWRESVSTLFEKARLAGVPVRNRIVIPPMSLYCAKHGIADRFQVRHYGTLAAGGAGCVVIEQTAVSREGRITNGCLGLWNDGQTSGVRAIVDSVHDGGAAAFIQLNHSGRKGCMQRAWLGNGPLHVARELYDDDDVWEPAGPSANPVADGWATPRPMTREEMDEVIRAFESASERAIEAGVDGIEVHMAHGYLLQNFLSPLANTRTDNYGGSIANRMRFPLAVVEAVMAKARGRVPVIARISCTDWVDGGWDMEDSLVLARELAHLGVRNIACSSGGNLRAGATNSSLQRGPGYQVEFACAIRHQVGVQTIAVGLIRYAALAERIVAEGSADFVAIGRQSLYDPYWARHAAESLGGVDFGEWPAPYGWWLNKWVRHLDDLHYRVSRSPSPSSPQSGEDFDETDFWRRHEYLGNGKD